jgi:hypothetical protein
LNVFELVHFRILYKDMARIDQLLAWKCKVLSFIFFHHHLQKNSNTWVKLKTFRFFLWKCFSF